MKKLPLLFALAFAITLAFTAEAQTAIPESLVTPKKVETRAGKFEFINGMPNQATIDNVYDNLDYTHAYNAIMNTYNGVNVMAIQKGIHAAGIKNNQILIFSNLMDAKSLFLTANADTVYFVGILDLTDGPMILETPPGALGTLDDFWWRWITDFGAPGRDRGEGGKYLVLPPDYKGPLPEGGFYVCQAHTTKVLILGRSFMKDNDPKPTVDIIRSSTKIYPYEVGGVGTSIAEFLKGDTKLAKIKPIPETVFVEGTGLVMNTIPPSDFSAYEMLNDMVQDQPATSLDPELMGSLAEIGIIKGKPFAPDPRMKKIMTEALATANATSRTLLFNPKEKDWYYYPNSAWMNFLFISGSEFETPIPMITKEGVKPFAPTGYRTLNARSAFFYGVTGITPAMAMRLPGIGSQYLFSMMDSKKQYFDGAKTYKVVLPKDIPQANFWSFTLYDNMTRSMLDTPQKYPRAGSQSFPSPAAEANADGSTTIYFGPKQPDGVKRGNWIQTIPGKGWFTILRLYSPLEPFFDKSWRPSEIEAVK